MLNARRFDHLRYRGPGTDLTIGLHPESAWQAALDESRGIKHVANMPTEEVFTTPDARRVEGTVRSTLPLQIQGNIVRGLEVRFEGGRAVEVHAESGEEVMREHITTDDGAARLGEVALVDGHSRVGQTGLVFYDTLFDENASSHIALGTSIVQAVPWASDLSPGGAKRARRQPLVDPHRLHDRLERARDRRRRRRTATPCRSCATATGCPVRPGRVGTVGFEPTASASQRRRSDQAELRPVRRRVDVGSVGGP